MRDIGLSRPKWIGRLAWTAWGMLWSCAVWAYIWSTGPWVLEWPGLLDLLPFMVMGSLSGLMLSHFGIPGGKLGLGVMLIGLCLVPAVDLLVWPGCANVDAVEFYRTPEGSLETRCTELADTRTSTWLALGGVLPLAILLALAGHLRRSRSRDHAGP